MNDWWDHGSETKKFRNVWDGNGMSECVECGHRVSSVAEMMSHQCPEIANAPQSNPSPEQPCPGAEYDIGGEG